MVRRGGRGRRGGARRGGRRVRKMRMLRGVRQPVQYFKRSVWKAADIIASPGVGVNNNPDGSYRWNYSFSLNDMPGFTEFQALYDQYKIKAVKVSLFPKFSQSEGPDATMLNSNNLPQVMSILDYDSLATPWLISDLVQYQNLKVSRGNRVHTRYLKPRNLIQMYNGIASTGYAVSRSMWLDTSNSSIPHYGLYGIVDTSQVGTGVRVVYDVKIDYYIAVKNVK